MHHEHNPDFIGIGGEKTASTWLYKCLLEHPEICGPEKKELCYFDTVKIIGWPAREKSEYELHGIEGYYEHFLKCPTTKVTGEFTVTYLHDTKVAPLLASLFPKTKIIVSIRNPIDRAYSQYTGLREVDRKSLGSFEEALKREPEFIRRSTYAPYLALYLKHFKRDQIHVVLHDDVVQNPEQVLRDLFLFLGVDPTFIPPSAQIKERSAEQKKLQTFRDTMYAYAPLRALGKLIRAVGIAPRVRAFLIGRLKKGTMSLATRAMLYTQFKDDIEETGRLIGRDLSHWR